MAIHGAFIEKQVDEGIGRDEIVALIGKIDTDTLEFFPYDIPASEVESSAIGFIDADALERMNFETKRISDVLVPVMNDMTLENKDCLYEIPMPEGQEPITVWFGRNL